MPHDYSCSNGSTMASHGTLNRSRMRLQAFIVSITPSATMRRQWSMEKSEMQRRHVLFQKEDKDTYIGAMLRA